MIEILKPNDYHKIIEGLYELNDERDIMQYLENYHAKYAEDNYHFSAILSEKISEIDDYDATQDVQRYYYDKGNDDPYCEIVFYKDAPNPVIRFAKVYIDYLTYCDDLIYPNDEITEEEESIVHKMFTTTLNKNQLAKLYQHLIDKEIMEANSIDHFLSIFDGYKTEEEVPGKVKWKLKHQNQFNLNLPMITLFRFISTCKDNTNDFYGEERKKFIETIIQNITSVSDKYPFNRRSLNNSISDWIKRIEVYQKRRKPSDKVQPLDQESIDIITFIKALNN
ncbi:MAG: hypothetical protein WC756_06625 [Taibaiella sp.]|jgi:hypothetical protein